MSGTTPEPDILDGIDLAAVLGQQITAEDVAGLNDEEKQAIRELADEHAAAADDDGPETTDAPDPDPEPDPAPAREPEPVQPEPPPEPIRIPDVTEHQKVLSTAEAEKDAIFDRYDDGEITKEEMRAQLKQIEDRVREAERAVQDRDSAAQLADQAYREEVNRMKTDYPDLFSPQHFNGFNAVVMEMQAHPASVSLTDRQLFERAAAEYAKFVGIDLPAAGKPRTEQKDEPRGLAPKTGKPPADPSLRTIPQSDIPQTDEGTFAAVRRQIEAADDPYEAEAIIERLTEEQRERLLREVG